MTSAQRAAALGLLAALTLGATAPRAQNAPLPLSGPTQPDALCMSQFRGLDPLAGAGEIMPKARQRTTDFCQAPLPDWQLVGEDRGRCCFFRPFAERLDAVVASRAQAAGIAAQGGRCGHNQFDPTTLICQLPPGSAPPGPPPPADRCAWPQLGPYVQNVLAALDHFWRPCLQRLTGAEPRPLGSVEDPAAPGPARYGNRTGRIEVNPQQLVERCRAQGNRDVVGLVLAHETGHYAQMQMRLSQTLYAAGVHELHADYLAGAFLGTRLASASQGQIDEVQHNVEQAFRSDQADPPAAAEDPHAAFGGRDPHGTAEERMRAFRLGLRDRELVCRALEDHTRPVLLEYLTPAALR